jgi:AcrR family transcriptional regulator
MPKQQRVGPARPESPASSTDIRVPQQDRSRQRAEIIVKVSRDLITKHGVLGLKMTEIAVRARVPIGSVYQYFPTKSALIAHLFARTLGTYHVLGAKCLGAVTSAAECAAAIRHVVVDVYKDNRRDALMREIWSGVQADRTIRQLHLADNAFFSQLFFDALRRVGSTIPREQLFRRCQIINEMWDGTIRLAITLDKRVGDALVDESIQIGLADLGLTPRSAD